MTYFLHSKCEGNDTLGALLMGHDFKSWWTGSNMSIEESRRLVPGQNATTVQVIVENSKLTALGCRWSFRSYYLDDRESK